ncbi:MULTISPECIES: RNA-binding S4 domain-containing protein [Rhodomicrobium]|uniref:RNA-binding S4 domain-containing protein n=1 Tax=Rhodomicrobium TaxID=1068 RepID=UPI000B4BD4B5|nr:MULTISPECIES: RNA-binding S4 domain-containing protein [Rhodomicrobium]
MASQGDARETQRLDKWLWHARIVKTRSLAADLVAQGKFRINREKVVKPASPVKCGDVITAAVFGRVRILQITGFSPRRCPPSEAQKLYLDLTPPSAPAPAQTP